MEIIRIEQLTRLYGQRVGIENLSLKVPAGALYGFLGPNGSGKTTTIRVLLGLLKPTRGSAAVFGLDCWRDSHRIKADLGYLPGDLRLYPWMTCRTALRIFGAVRGRDLLGHGLELADDFSLEPDVRARAMSRGMRQKLGLILALSHRPRVLILDEPTTALDPLMQDKLTSRLRNLAASGHTVFFSSHTLSEVERLCDRVAILREGRLMADSTVAELRSGAGRVVTIRWREDAQLDGLTPPDLINIRERADRHWQGTLRGPVMELVRWCADKPIDDLSIGQPDLAGLFQQYYADEEPNE